MIFTREKAGRTAPALLLTGISPESFLRAKVRAVYWVMTWPLLILLCQQKRLITLQTGYSHLKLVAELYDSCQETLLQYIEFLQTAIPPDD